MASKQTVIIILSLAVLVGGVLFLSRAVEPPRETAVDVLENDRFNQ
jgi:hypothetical protein